MITCPNTRPSGAASTHSAKAWRESAATLPVGPGTASDKRLLRHGLAGAGRYQVGHGGVGADRSAVVDGPVFADRNLPGETEVLRDRLAGVPPLRDEQGDQDHVVSLNALDDRSYLGLLVKEPDLDEIVDPPFPDTPRVQVDDAP